MRPQVPVAVGGPASPIIKTQRADERPTDRRRATEPAHEPGEFPTVGQIAVVGGGISGLAAAWFAKQFTPDADVVLFEGSSLLGGKPHAAIPSVSADASGHRLPIGGLTSRNHRIKVFALV